MQLRLLGFAPEFPVSYLALEVALLRDGWLRDFRGKGRIRIMCPIDVGWGKRRAKIGPFPSPGAGWAGSGVPAEGDR